MPFRNLQIHLNKLAQQVNLLTAVRLSVSARIVFQSHLATCNRNGYEYVWYYKRLQHTRISDDMPADNRVS